MYLLEHYVDENKTYDWVGAIEGQSQMTNKLTRFGYVNLTANVDNVLCHKGAKINAHEFHYSDSTNNGNGFEICKASGKGKWEGAHTTESLYAGYPHMHLWGNSEFARSFVEHCRKFAEC